MKNKIWYSICSSYIICNNRSKARFLPYRLNKKQSCKASLFYCQQFQAEIDRGRRNGSRFDRLSRGYARPLGAPFAGVRGPKNTEHGDRKGGILDQSPNRVYRQSVKNNPSVEVPNVISCVRGSSLTSRMASP